VTLTLINLRHIEETKEYIESNIIKQMLVRVMQEEASVEHHVLGGSTELCVTLDDLINCFD